MEKEQKKLSSGVVILIITLVVALITVSTMYALELLKEDDVNKQQITGENNELKETETSKDENKEEKEDTTNKVENKVEKEDKEEEKQNEDILEKSKKFFGFNGKEHELEVSIEQIEEGKQEIGFKDVFLYNLNYTVKLNGIEVENLEEGSGNKNIQNNYELSRIEDKNNGEEYLLFKIYQYRPSGAPSIIIHIINENAELLGKVNHFGGASFSRWDEKEEKIIEEFELEINEENIIDYCLAENSNNLEKHVYTMKNGEFIDTIEKVYQSEEFIGSGAKR